MTPQREEPEAESDGQGWQSRMPGGAWDEIREVVGKSITEQTWMRGGPSCLDFPVTFLWVLSKATTGLAWKRPPM